MLLGQSQQRAGFLPAPGVHFGHLLGAGPAHLRENRKNSAASRTVSKPSATSSARSRCSCRSRSESKLTIRIDFLSVRSADAEGLGNLALIEREAFRKPPSATALDEAPQRGDGARVPNALAAPACGGTTHAARKGQAVGEAEAVAHGLPVGRNQNSSLA